MKMDIARRKNAQDYYISADGHIGRERIDSTRSKDTSTVVDISGEKG
jgi:hypothetical protein